VPKVDGRGRGDLYVEARVRVPRFDDERSRELLRELAKREDAGALRRNLGVAEEG
jgi:DnaJ-class molecular chaperone